MRCFLPVLVLALLAGAPAAVAQSPRDGDGPAGFHFLNLGTSARLEAMAGAGTALASGADAVVWNPARLARHHGLDVSSSFFTWLDDVRSGYVGAALSLPLGIGIGGSARALSVPEFNNVPGESAIGQSDMAVSAGLGIPVLWSPLEVGASVKLIRSSLADEAALGAAITAGLNYRYVEGWNAALALRNYGLATAYGDTTPGDQLPTQAAFAIGGQLADLRFDTEVFWENGQGWAAAVGGEYWYRDALALRAGSRFGQGESAMSPWAVGMGIRARRNFELGYAFRDGDLNASHRLEVRWTPGRRPDEWGTEPARSPRDFYLDVVREVIDQSLANIPTDVGNTVIVRGAAPHEANSLISAEISSYLQARSFTVETRDAPDSTVQPKTAIPDTLDAALRAQVEAALAEQTGSAPIDGPLLEFEIVASDYLILQSKRLKGVGPRSVERRAELDLGFRLTAPGRADPVWTSSGRSDETEEAAVADIQKSAGYPRPRGTGVNARRKLHPAVEPVIVGGIVAGLAVIFFSNRDVGQ